MAPVRHLEFSKNLKLQLLAQLAQSVLSCEISTYADFFILTEKKIKKTTSQNQYIGNFDASNAGLYSHVNSKISKVNTDMAVRN